MDGIRDLLESNNSRRLRRRATRDDIDSVSEISWPSRPTTKDSLSSAASGRLSTDSGAGSLDDFNRQGSTPLPTTFLDFWDGVRRHTAPPRKTTIAQSSEDNRPNTVHAWNVFPSRNAMSKYTPLPAIGIRPQHLLAPKYCFQETGVNYDSVDSQDDENAQEEYDISDVHPDLMDSLRACASEDDSLVFRRSIPKVTSALTSLSLESEVDSDFDEESESCILYASDDDDEDGQRTRRPVVRSATFTIEDRKPSFEATLLLAIRLPDGSRVSGQFSVADTLKQVCETALSKYSEPLGKYELVTTEVPKRTFSDLSMSLQAAGIADKTLLNIQPRDDYESD